jgi:hypothetical protein
MFRNPFDGARAKIARSHAHFRELGARERKFSKQGLTIDAEPQPNGDTIVFTTVAQLPSLDDAAVVADIVGNFRSALDIAVSQACRVRGEMDSKKLNKTYFAFGGSERDWTNNLNNRMAGADQLIRDTVKAFKPWNEGGNAILYALSKICADDKHVDLVPVATRPSQLTIDGLKLTRDDGLRCGIQGYVPTWGSSERVAILTAIAPAKVEITGPCVLEARFGFGNVYALTGQPVIATLNQMGGMCEEIINAIEAAVI